jgi:hypothetical protein
MQSRDTEINRDVMVAAGWCCRKKREMVGISAVGEKERSSSRSIDERSACRQEQPHRLGDNEAGKGRCGRDILLEGGCLGVHASDSRLPLSHLITI